MVPDRINHLDPTGQPTPPDRGTEKVSSDPAFRRMLERLEELAKRSDTQASKEVSKPDASKPDTAKVDDTEEFIDALKKADDDFVAAMDLRRKLEEAYRRSQP